MLLPASRHTSTEEVIEEILPGSVSRHASVEEDIEEVLPGGDGRGATKPPRSKAGESPVLPTARAAKKATPKAKAKAKAGADAGAGAGAGAGAASTRTGDGKEVIGPRDKLAAAVETAATASVWWMVNVGNKSCKESECRKGVGKFIVFYGTPFLPLPLPLPPPLPLPLPLPPHLRPRTSIYHGVHETHSLIAVVGMICRC